MTIGTPRELIILPSLKARQGAQGGLVMTQKYLDGVAEYARTWPGPVTSLVYIDTRPGIDMDQVETGPELPTSKLELRPEDIKALAAHLEQAAIVLALLSPYEAETAAICHRNGVPVVFVSEYTPRTEIQIIDATTPNPLRRLRRRFYIQGVERRRRQMLRDLAAGLQCSGTPTYDLYNSIAPNPMLFFDNRVPAADVIDDGALKVKCARMASGAPLRLVFGGRITAMKGVLELPRVAKALDRHGVPYQMDIYGSGDLEEALRREISQGALSDRVALHPPMDFRSGWIPLLKRQADLFVCCHPQGDPSSTYPEVMSCGVPIVGYANEAFSGIVRESGAGWSVPMRDATALAAQIARLHSDRGALQDMARQGRGFAQDHCFEATFEKRTQHLIRASRLPEAEKPLHIA
ncbi:glycosyltransferase [Primorskyibacter flagellatus]|uniref:Glycosyltransferase involved in cell wall bisynthesis n=1 Tax=Primorskyibacter flagellatus TaxID=1387277 RepID=A0A1W2E127_9RHOB|nr:glycosyltransferase [Primorskyibacter flagellatus]SMD03092.1 Glycosyltransferase involved in cell wall bisynthesis [Primorskyibacter flagellatus]